MYVDTAGNSFDDTPKGIIRHACAHNPHMFQSATQTQNLASPPYLMLWQHVQGSYLLRVSRLEVRQQQEQ